MKLFLSLAVAGTLLVSGMVVSASGVEDGSSLVTAKCSSCHNMKRICNGLGKKDLGAWEKTNARMVKKGMAITDGDLDMINRYLASAKADGTPFCQ